MSYEPISYWREAGKTYYQNFKYNDDYKLQEQKLVEYLKTIDFKSVLEFGCGFGRITKLIQNFKPTRYVAVDISADQLTYIPNAQRVVSDISEFETDEKFDLVIAVEVLMHQLPSKIKNIINKMISLSKKHVINVDYYYKGEELAPHNFNHDYPDLYKIVTRVPINKQSIFHYQK